MTITEASHRVVPGTPHARVGCSGWQYKHWRGDFYPSELPMRRWLEHYASQFDTVEINNSFYRLPEAATFASWRDGVPAGFLYSVKASRFLTHMKKLKDPEAPLQRLFDRAAELGDALGPVLYQLPPRWPVDLDRFRTFLAALPTGRAHVVEFRDPSWYAAPVYDALAHHGVAMCLHDFPGAAAPARRPIHLHPLPRAVAISGPVCAGDAGGLGGLVSCAPRAERRPVRLLQQRHRRARPARRAAFPATARRCSAGP
jgi:uncharacterized protein YecE (DUF72 family)